MNLKSGTSIPKLLLRILFTYVADRFIAGHSKEMDNFTPPIDTFLEVYEKNTECSVIFFDALENDNTQADALLGVYEKDSETNDILFTAHEHLRGRYPADVLDIYLDQCENDQKKVLVARVSPFPKFDADFSEDGQLLDMYSAVPKDDEKNSLMHDGKPKIETPKLKRFRKLRKWIKEGCCLCCACIPKEET